MPTKPKRGAGRPPTFKEPPTVLAARYTGPEIKLIQKLALKRGTTRSAAARVIFARGFAVVNRLESRS